jgi:uncharacterized membrane protein YraQ (UPF0718 family)
VSAAPATPVRARRFGSLELFAAGAAALVLARPAIAHLFERPALQSWATVFVAICLQALPFLVLGVTLAALIAAFLPREALERLLPRNPALAVPAAGLAGVALPGCECASVPIAGRLIGGGAPPAAALTFLLAAPAINPVVLVSTSVAFPGQSEMVAARFAASLVTSVVVGWVWLRMGRTEWIERALHRHPPEASRAEVFRASAVHDVLHAGGYLVVGALAAATLSTVVPRSVLEHIGGAGPLALLVTAGLAVALCICSEADAFVAASLTDFNRTAKLVFMVVGPTVDLKLIAMQAGVFSRSFVLRFAPLTFAIAVTSAVLVSWVLL